MKKRFLSFLLCLTMFGTMAPVSAAQMQDAEVVNEVAAEIQEAEVQEAEVLKVDVTEVQEVVQVDAVEEVWEQNPENTDVRVYEEEPQTVDVTGYGVILEEKEELSSEEILGKVYYTSEQLTEEYVYNAMMAMKTQFPEGMRYTNENYYGWRGGYFTGGYGCAGFAFALSDAAFGDNPARFLKEANGSYITSFDHIRVGDILRVNKDTHSVIVLKVFSDYVQVAEGNYNSSVHWGRLLRKDSLEAGELTYIMTRYPDEPIKHNFQIVGQTDTTVTFRCTDCGKAEVRQCSTSASLYTHKPSDTNNTYYGVSNSFVGNLGETISYWAFDNTECGDPLVVSVDNTAVVIIDNGLSSKKGDKGDFSFISTGKATISIFSAYNNKLLKSYTVTVKDPYHKHNMVKVDRVEPTCTTKGRNLYYRCTSCGINFRDANGVSELVNISDLDIQPRHNVQYVATKAATCTETGLKAHYACTVCGKICTDYTGLTVMTDLSPLVLAASHNMMNITAHAANCFNDGNKAYFICLKCDGLFWDKEGKQKISSRAETLIPAEHKLTMKEAVAATCTTNGNKTYFHCSVCGNNYYDINATKYIDNLSETVISGGHKLTDVAAKAATCTEKGWIRHRVCSVCGKIFSTDGKEIKDFSTIEVSADHQYETIWKSNDSGHWHVCVFCGAKDKVVAHTAGEKATETKPQTCTVCKYIISPKLSHTTHSLKKVAAKDATCTAEGNITYYCCTQCNKYFSDAEGKKEITDKSTVIIKPSHSMESVYTMDNVNHWYACKYCGSEKKNLGKHVFSNSADTTCDVCGYVRKVSSLTLVTDCFRDVKVNQWYVPYVQYVFDAGIMKGKSQITFGTGDNITRAEFVQVLYNMENKPQITFKKRFSDVDSSMWFASAVTWAADKGITSGYENGAFGANDNITREQMALMLYKYAVYKNKNVKIDSNATSTFVDRKSVSSWAKNAVDWAVTQKIISGKPKGNGYALDPIGFAKREECATMIRKILQE